ncbi:MAG: peptidoglycan DD-metalloendopeptidase family protein [Candidatus Flexifilum sp.]
MKRRCPLLIAVLLLVAPVLTGAQGQCPPVNAVVFPLDAAPPVLVQDFAAQNARFHGRFHTGQDWIGSGPVTLGMPVRAAAAGRVTFSSPTAWGRDGGVIIIEHTLPDGATVYTMYGHLTDAFGQAFPPAFTCVEAGQIIGAVADVRPAPHLHWEARTAGSDRPGAGYSWRHPAAEGLLNPAQWLTHIATALDRAFRWRAALAGIVAPPVLLPGSDLIALSEADGQGQVIGLSYDGRILWRYTPERRAAALIPYQSAAAILYADGTAQRVGLDGRPEAIGALPGPVTGRAFAVGGRIYVELAGGLSAFAADLRGPLWTLADLRGVSDVVASADGRILGVMAARPTGRVDLFVVEAGTGAVIDRALLREPGALAPAPGGGLIAYTRGGLWQIDERGVWSLLIADAAGGGRAGALARGAGGADDQFIYTFTGTTLTSRDRQLVPRWTGDLPGDPTYPSWMAERDDRLYLIAGDRLRVFDVERGVLCAEIPLWRGMPSDRLWADLGADGTLRALAGGQITGFDLGALRRTCG